MVLFALTVGAAPVSLWDGLTDFLQLLGLASGEESTPGLEIVFWQLRLPRVLLAALVGASLAMAGAIMQGLFRNPLADPGLVGVSSGAAVGAVTVLVLGSVASVAWLADERVLPLAAFLGALVTAAVVQSLSRSSGITSVATLLLAGIAVNALAGSLMGLGTFFSSDAQLRSLSFWMLGSLGAASWKTLLWTLPLCGVLLVGGMRYASTLNALALGEAEAGHLGVGVERMKRHLILLTAAGVGACVAFTGIIGFLGLVVPHLARLWLGPDHRTLLPASALLGAVLLVLADALARTLAAPAEIPIGILTSLFGSPFFLWMLLRERGRVLWR
jgi:iron complex transport system permease protein